MHLLWHSYPRTALRGWRHDLSHFAEGKQGWGGEMARPLGSHTGSLWQSQLTTGFQCQVQSGADTWPQPRAGTSRRGSSGAWRWQCTLPTCWPQRLLGCLGSNSLSSCPMPLCLHPLPLPEYPSSLTSPAPTVLGDPASASAFPRGLFWPVAPWVQLCCGIWMNNEWMNKWIAHPLVFIHTTINIYWAKHWGYSLWSLSSKGLSLEGRQTSQRTKGPVTSLASQWGASWRHRSNLRPKIGVSYPLKSRKGVFLALGW